MKIPGLAKSTILGICSLTVGFVISLAPPAAASTVYATNITDSELQAIDTSTNLVTWSYGTPATPPDLAFDGQNQIL